MFQCFLLLCLNLLSVMASINSCFALSFGALTRILTGESQDNAILQILGYKQIPGSNGDRFRLLLNDGVVHFPYAVLATQLNNLIYDKNLEKYTIFKLKKYVHSQILPYKKIIICLGIEVLFPGSQVNEIINEENFNCLQSSCVAELKSYVVSQTPNSLTNTSDIMLPSTSNLAQNWDIVQSYAASSTLSDKNENNQFSVISSLSPYRSKWTIKARVSYKTPIISYNNSQKHGKYFSANFLDESGEIKATAFNENAERFFNLFEVFKVYIISNGNVKPAPENAYLKNDFEMIIENYTKVKPCVDDQTSVPMPTFNFLTIRQITFLPEGSYTDVIGVCHKISCTTIVQVKLNNQQMFKREITLIDKSLKSITVKLWGTHAQHFSAKEDCVIAAKNVKVSYFNSSISLSASATTMIYIDPDIDKTYKLKSWYQSLDKVASQSAFSCNSVQTASENWKTFSEVLAVINEKNIGVPLYHTTKATITLVRKENCLYKACTTLGCLKKLIELDDNLFKCCKCNINLNTFKWVLLLQIQLADFTGSQWAMVFKEIAESLLGFDSDQLQRLKVEDEDKFYDVLNELNLKTFVFKMRSNFETYNEKTHLKSSILSFSPVVPKFYTEKLITDIKKMSRMLNDF